MKEDKSLVVLWQGTYRLLAQAVFDAASGPSSACLLPALPPGSSEETVLSVSPQLP